MRLWFSTVYLCSDSKASILRIRFPNLLRAEEPSSGQVSKQKKDIGIPVIKQSYVSL